ncbi:MAG: hypothetical protein H7Y27_13585, partial [Gemmatimonadaceae bacterium]|nr:hypothetical protein [Chitinophagaceae bacterium]
WVGNFIYKRILPRTDGTVYKMKAPGFLQVKTAVPNGNTTIERLLRYIDDFDHILEQGSYVDIQQLRVPVPGVPLVSFRLGDCLRFMVAHNERHLLQAQKIFATFVPQPAVQPYKSPGSTGSDLVNVFGN